MNSITSLRPGPVLLAALLLFGHALRAAVFDNNLDKTFPGTPGGKLLLEAEQGDCNVATTGSDKVEIHVLRQVKGGTQSHADELFANNEVNFRQEGETVTIVSKSKKHSSFSRSANPPSLGIRYELKIPKRFDVDLKTAGGDIHVGDLDGKAKARTASGTIDLRHIAGKVEAANSGGDIVLEQGGAEVSAQTSSGSIKVQKVNGNAKLSNSGGDVVVGNARESLTAKTSSGAIRIKSVSGDLEASNSGGDITAEVVGGAASATTSSGSISLGRVKGKTVTARNSGGDIEIGEADGAVVATTSSGALKIKKAGGTLEAKNSGGDITIGQALGHEAVARTSSGAIRIKSASGKLSIVNSGGDIEAAEVRGSVHAATSSGSISVGLVAQPTEDCALEVSGGEIKLILPKDIAINIDAKSSGGRVKSELPVTMTVAGAEKEGVIQGKISRGGPKMYLRSSSGDIDIRASSSIASDKKK